MTRKERTSQPRKLVGSKIQELTLSLPRLYWEINGYFILTTFKYETMLQPLEEWLKVCVCLSV